MKSTIALSLIFFFNFNVYAESKCFDSKLDDKKTRDCLRKELIASNPEIDSKAFEQVDTSNPWVEILNSMHVPIGSHLLKEYSKTKLQALDAEYVKEQEVVMKEFSKLLANKVKAGSAPLTPEQVSKLFSDVQSYNVLKKYMKKETPSFEEFQLNPDKYDISYVSLQAKGIKDRSKNKCEEVTESYVICDGERYERVKSTTSELRRKVKVIDENLKDKADGTSKGIAK